MTKIIQRHDTAANWTSVNPTLSQGEFGVEDDTGKFKIGDGQTAWNSLAYASSGGSGETDAYTKAETDELLGEKADKFTTSAPLTLSEKSDAEYDGTITNGTISFDGVNSFVTISDVLYASAHNGDRIIRYVALPLDVNTIVKAPIMGNFNNTSEYGQIREQVLLGDFDNEGKFIPYVGILNERRSNNYYGRMNGGATISNINPNGAYGLAFTYTSPSSHNHAAYNLETATPGDAPIESQSIYVEKYIDSTGVLSMGVWTVGDVDGSSIQNMVSTTFDGSIGAELQEACKKSKWVLFFPANNGLTPNIGDFKIYETNGRHGWDKAGLLSGITNAPYKQPLVSSTANIALLVDNSTIKVNDNGQLYAVAQESPAPTNMVTTDTEQEITGSKLFSNGLKVGGYAGISDNNNVPFIKTVPDGPNTLHAWEIGCNDSTQFKDIMVRRDVNGRYINIDSGNISEYVSGIEEQLSNKTDMVQAAQASMPSSKYVDLTIGANADTYNAPSNGWFCLGFKHPSNTTYIYFELEVLDGSGNFLYNVAATRNLKEQIECVLIPIKDGHKLRVRYSNFTVTRFRFVYAEGAK